MSGLLDRVLAYVADNDTVETKKLRYNGTGDYVIAQKRNGIVTLNIYINTISLSTSYTTIATLPVGWRPDTTAYFSGMPIAEDVSKFTTFAIDASNGNILVRRASGSGSMMVGGLVSFAAVA